VHERGPGSLRKGLLVVNVRLVRMNQDQPPVGLGRSGAAGSQVLVVDDDAHVREALARWLSRAGYTVSSAEGFTEAMDVLAAASPHALVIDVRLRDFN
jgi:PleD family two-component response regulator